jgi:vancomycin resistance protein YoaR
MTSETPYIAPRPRGQQFSPWLIRLPVLLISGGFLLVLVLTIFVSAFQLRYRDKIVPGISAYGVNLSGMARDEALAALVSFFTYDDEAIFTFRDGDRFWQMTAGELGVSFDVEATVDQALAPGHSGNLLADTVDQASVWLNGRSISPIILYDQQVAADHLLAIAEEINRPPQNAALTIDGRDVSITPSQSGRTLDIPATLSRLENVLIQLNTGAELPLVVNETPPTIWNAEEAAASVRTALSAPVTLIAESPDGGTLGPWMASVDQIAALLSLQLADNGDGTQRYHVTINMDAFQGYLEELAPGLIVTPRDARFHFNEETGQLEIIQAEVSGRTLDVEGTLARLEEGIFVTGNRTVPMAFHYTPARYPENITAAELGITELVSEATTYYTGSTRNRLENIIEAASRFDGVIIAPHTEFSFNTLLGDISPETGFVQGKIIFGGRTIDGVGGGVCQVSTTAFRAAFSAGFPIIERNSHGYRVGFYELNSGPGMDAAIFQPEADFRFMNDTDYHLLIESSVFPATSSVQFRFYSTNPGRQVVLEQPLVQNVTPPRATVFQQNDELTQGVSQQVDWAAEGADVTVTRIILDANGTEIERDELFTHYEPWAAVVQVAPGDPRLTA